MKKFLSYVLTFLLLFVLSAGVTISLTVFGPGNSIPQLGMVDGQDSAYTTFSGILSAFEEKKQFNVTANIEIVSNEQVVPLNVYVNLDISDLSDLRLEGYVEADFKNKENFFEFAYFKNTTFLNYKNNSFKFSTSSIKQLVSAVQGLVQSDKGSGLSDFDTDAILQKLMASLDTMMETELEDGGKKLEIDVEDFAEIEIYVDEELAPNKLVIKSEDVGGFSFSAEANVTFNDSIVIADPEKANPGREYLDASSAIDLVKNSLDFDAIEVAGNVGIGDSSYQGRLLFDKNTKNVQLFADNLDLTYLDGNLFFGYNGSKIMLSKNLLNSSPKLKENIEDKITFGDNLFVSKAKQVLSALKNIDVNKVLNLVKEIETSSKGLRAVVDGELFGLDGEFTLEVLCEDGKITGVNVFGMLEGKSFLAEFELKDLEEKIAVEESEYLNVEKLIEVNKDYYLSKSANINFDLALAGKQNFSLKGNASLDANNKYFASSLDVFYQREFSLDLDAINSDLFVKLNNIMVKANKEGIENVLSDLGLDEKVSEAIANLKEKIEKTLDDAKSVENTKIDITNILSYLSYIKEFEISPERLSLLADAKLFGYEGEVKVTICLEDNIIKTVEINGLKVKDNNIDLYLEVTSNEVSQREIEVNKYLDVSNLYFNTKNTNFKEGDIYGYVSALANGEAYNLDFHFAGSVDDQKMAISAVLDGSLALNLDVLYEGKTAFAKIDNMYLKMSTDNFKEFMKNHFPDVDTSVETDDIEIVQRIKDVVSDFSLDTLDNFKNVIINSNLIQIVIDKNLLGTAEDVTLRINLYKDNIKEVEISSFDYNGITLSTKMLLTPGKTQIADVNRANYLDVLAFIENTLAIDYTKGNIYGYLDGMILGKEYSADFQFGGSYKDKDFALALALSGAINADIDVRYVGDYAYVHYNNNYIKVPKTLVVSMIGKLTDGEETNKIDMEEIKAKLQDKFKDFDLSSLTYLKDIKITSSNISFVLGKELSGLEEDVKISIDLYKEKINQIDVKNLALGEDTIISFKALINFNEPSYNPVDDSIYLDYDKLVAGLNSLLESKTTNVDGTLGFTLTSGEKFDISLQILKSQLNSLNGFTNISVLHNGEDINLLTYYQSNNLFAEMNGLKVKINKDTLQETVNNVLSLLGKDPTAYKNIIGAIYALLDGRGVKGAISEYGLNIENSAPKIDTSNIKITFDQILNLLENTSIGASGISTIISKDILGTENDLELSILLNDYALTNIYIKNGELNGYKLDANINFDYSETEIPTLSEDEQSKFIDLYQTSVLAEIAYNTIKTGEISGNFRLMFEYGEEQNYVDVNYGVKIDKEFNITAYLQAEYKNNKDLDAEGVKIDIVYVDRVFYLNIIGLKIDVQFKEINDLIDFLNENFSLSIGHIDTEVKEEIKEEKTLSERFSQIANLNLDIIDKVTFFENNSNVYLKNGMILSLNYALDSKTGEKKLSTMGLQAEKQKFNVELYCTGFDNVAIQEVDPSEYKPYTLLTETFIKAKNTILKQKTGIVGKAETFAGKVENELPTNVVDIEMGISYIAKKLKFNGFVNVNNEHSVNVGLMTDPETLLETLYVNYDALKVKMDQSSFKELASIILEVLGVDPTTIGFLSESAGNLDINTDNLEGLFPAIDLGNPLNMIHLLKNIYINEEGSFVLTLDGKLINQDGRNMYFAFTTGEEYIDKVVLRNIYTGKEDQYFNFEMSFTDIENVEDIAETNTFIDISKSPDLIGGLINTSALNEWHIDGKAQLNITTGNGDGSDLATMGITIDVKLDEDKKPTIAVELTNFPGLTLLFASTCNNAKSGFGLFPDATGPGIAGNPRYRKLSFYYREGDLYIKSVDQAWGSYKEYVRFDRITPQYLMDNLKTYLYWMFGFSDLIQNPINDSVDKAMSNTNKINISKLLLGYTYDEEFQVHNVRLDLAELMKDPGNTSLGELSLSFTTEEVEEEVLDKDGNPVIDKETGKAVTKYRHYVSALGFDMQFASVVHVRTDNLKKNSEGTDRRLNVNVKEPAHLEEAERYMSSYAYGRFDEHEYFVGNNDNAVVNLYTSYNGIIEGNVQQLSGGFGTNIPWPNFNKQVVREEGNQVVTYEFKGLYNQDGGLYDQTTFYETGINVYARYEEVSRKTKYTLRYFNGTGLLKTETILEGDVIAEFIPTKNYQDFELYREYYEFGYWQTLAGEKIELSTMPSANLDVYVHWNITQTKYVTFYVDSSLSGKGTKTVKLLEGSQYTLETLEHFFGERNAEGKVTEWIFGGYKLDENLYSLDNLSFTVDYAMNQKTFIAEWIEGDSYIEKLVTIYSVDAEGSTHYLDSNYQRVGKPLQINPEHLKEDSWLYTNYADSSKTFENKLSKDIDGNYIMTEDIVNIYISDTHTLTVTGKFVEDHHSNNVYKSFTIAEYKLHYGESIDIADIENKARAYDYTSNPDSVHDYAQVGKYFFSYKDLSDTNAMGHADKEIIANYNSGYRVYYKITFHLDWYAPEGRNGDAGSNPLIGAGASAVNPAYFLEGEHVTISTSQYSSEIDKTYKDGFWGTSKRHTFKTVGWNDGHSPATNNSYDASKLNQITEIASINRNYELYAIWKE